MLSKTAQKAIEAYGGIELWKNHRYIEAEVSAKGLAFTLKQRPFFERAKMIMEIERPYSKITPIGKDKAISGVLDGYDVKLENANGEVIAERKNARRLFPFGRRLFRWDDLDMAYFANYAFWNYFTLPRLLMNEDIEWIEQEEGLLQARFPTSIPTHSTIQTFRFDTETGLLIQHNYTADIITKVAKAANVVLEHKTTDSYSYPSLRKVTPQNLKGKPLDFPTLIYIEVSHFRFI